MSLNNKESIDSIVYRLRNNDTSAFEDLFDEFFPSLLKKAIYYVRDEDAAKDIVQEIFLNIWKNRATLHSAVNMKNYLERACINRALNYLRDRGKFSGTLVDDNPMLSDDSFRYTPDSILCFDELQIRIQRSIENLPERIRVPFQLSRFEQMTYKEIAASLGVSQVVVEKSIMQALKVLRVELYGSLKGK